MHDESLGPGTVTLKSLYDGRLDLQEGWGEYPDFRRLAKRCPVVEPVKGRTGTIYGIGSGQIGTLADWLADNSGRSGRHRWDQVQKAHNYAGSMTTSEVMEALEYDSRNSAYYLKRKIEVRSKDGVLRFNRDQVERLARAKGTFNNRGPGLGSLD